MSTTPSAAAVAMIEAGFLDTCTIRNPPRSNYTHATNLQATIAGDVAYAGLACSVAAAGDSTATDELRRGGEVETERVYQVSIPRSAVPSVGQHLTVTAVHAEGDAGLVNAELIIRRIRYGTRMARRILLCELIEAAAT